MATAQAAVHLDHDLSILGCGEKKFRSEYETSVCACPSQIPRLLHAVAPVPPYLHDSSLCLTHYLALAPHHNCVRLRDGHFTRSVVLAPCLKPQMGSHTLSHTCSYFWTLRHAPTEHESRSYSQHGLCCSGHSQACI